MVGTRNACQQGQASFLERLALGQSAIADGLSGSNQFHPVPYGLNWPDFCHSPEHVTVAIVVLSRSSDCGRTETATPVHPTCRSRRLYQRDANCRRNDLGHSSVVYRWCGDGAGSPSAAPLVVGRSGAVGGSVRTGHLAAVVCGTGKVPEMRSRAVGHSSGQALSAMPYVPAV